jgi:hypothetical protein
MENHMVNSHWRIECDELVRYQQAQKQRSGIELKKLSYVSIN